MSVFWFLLLLRALLKAKFIDKSKGIITNYSQTDICKQQENIYASSKTIVIFCTREDASTKIPFVLSEFCQEQRQVRVLRQQ